MFSLNRVMLHKLVESRINVYAWLCGQKYKLEFNARGILCIIRNGEHVEIPFNDSFEIVLD